MFCQGETYTIEFNNPPGAFGADDNPNNVLGYSYQWEQSDSENGPWIEADGTDNGETFTTITNEFLEETTIWYRCKVISNYCNNQSDWTEPVDVTFENTTDAGELNPVLNVCYGDTGELNFLTEPSGADTDNIFSYDDYTYLWEMAPSSEGPWEEADGTNNQETYSTTTNTVVVETTCLV